MLRSIEFEKSGLLASGFREKSEIVILDAFKQYLNIVGDSNKIQQATFWFLNEFDIIIRVSKKMSENNQQENSHLE